MVDGSVFKAHAQRVVFTWIGPEGRESMEFVNVDVWDDTEADVCWVRKGKEITQIAHTYTVRRVIFSSTAAD